MPSKPTRLTCVDLGLGYTHILICANEQDAYDLASVRQWTRPSQSISVKLDDRQDNSVVTHDSLDFYSIIISMVKIFFNWHFTCLLDFI